MRKAIGLLVGLIILTAHGAAQADLVTAPSALNPGDQYRLIFITSTTTDATSTDITTYNTFANTTAQAVPQLAALGTTWVALGSTDSVNARDNSSTSSPANIPIYQLNNTLFVANYTDLWSDGIVTPLTITEQGTSVTSGLVWTGSNSDGTLWTNGGFGPIQGLGTTSPGPILGTVNTYFGNWMVLSYDAPTSQYPVYALSGVLTVPVPEPASMILLLLGAAGLFAHRRSI